MASLLLPLLSVLLLQALLTSAQSCYYPDGSTTTVDAPCPNSDLCCPLNWQCLSNGLCYDPTNDYYERRTCTDSTWQSDDCPNFCTYSEGGNEAILLCSSGEYCCDGNRVSFDCCDGTLPPGTDYFNLPDGKVVGSIGSMGPAPTSSARSTSSATRTTSSSSETPTTTSEESSSARSFITSVETLMTTISEASTTRTMASTTTASEAAIASGQNNQTTLPANDPERSDSSSFGMGAIIGVAVGVSILLIICALIAFLLWRRHKKSRVPSYTSAPDSPTEIKYSDAFPPGTHAPEIDSSPKAPTGGTSELYGSDASTNVRNSTVSSMTAAGQGYSPTSMVSPVPGGGGSKMDQIPERHEPPAVELWGGPVYRPYRPGLEGQGKEYRS